MIFYISIFSVLAFLLPLDYVKDAKGLKSFIYLLIVIFFILLGGLRWETGTDWKTYYAFFQRSNAESTLKYETTFELGFRYLNYWVRNVSPEYTTLLLIMSLCIIGIKSMYLKKYIEYFFLGAFLYYAYFFFDVFFVRQSIAISIILLSTRFIISRKFIPFILLVLLASLFHGSAFFFILGYFLYKIKIPSWFMVFFICFGIALALLNIDVLLMQLALKVFGVEGYLGAKLNAYLEIGKNENFGAGVSKATVLILGIIKRAIVLPVFVWFRYKIPDQYREEYNGYLNLLMFGTFLYFITGNFMALQRISTYFTFYEILLILLTVRFIGKYVKPSIVYPLLILYAFAKFYYGFAGYKDLYVPYYSIFDSNINRVVY